MDNLHVLELHGEFDISQKVKIESDLDQIDTSGRTAVTILDLASVRHVDTTFLNALLKVRGRLAHTQPPHRIVLVASKTNIVWRLFVLSGMSDIFPLYETLAHAKRSESALLALATSDRRVERIERTEAWPTFVIEVIEPLVAPEDHHA